MPFPRRPLAVLLSCLGPGLGQVYLGRTGRGFVLLVLGLAAVPVVAAAALAPPSGLAFGAELLAAFVAVLCLVVGAVDAAIPRAGDGLRPPPSSRQVALGIAALVVLELAVGVGGALFTRAHLSEAFKIAGDSMQPTLDRGDRVLVTKQTTWDRPLRRGDVVVYHAAPGGPAYVKRVVALGGDTVALQGDAVIVNGRPMAPLGEPAPDGARRGVERYPDGGEVPVSVPPAAKAGPPVEVPSGSCWVLGDHREDAKDSRQHGPVPLDQVVGVVRYRYWPLSRVGLVD